ncbi:MAG: hypothetical protein JST14_13270 [Bacteroidetes bacterium]|nr:hypothetical protein [Bacteroidota bacterium]MBS1977518.1 hypothetical protein [Bacteroidota bacterium]
MINTNSHDRTPCGVLSVKSGGAVSNPNLPSETSDHRWEGGEPAAEKAFMKACEREGEVVFQFRCSGLIVLDYQSMSEIFTKLNDN